MEKIPEDMVIGEAMDVQLVCQLTKVKPDNRDTAFTGAIEQVNCNQNTDKNKNPTEKENTF